MDWPSGTSSDIVAARHLFLIDAVGNREY